MAIIVCTKCEIKFNNVLLPLLAAGPARSWLQMRPEALPDLTQQVLSLIIIGLFFFWTHKYRELFYPLRIGFWEVVRDTQQLNMSCGQPFESFWSVS